MMEPAPEFKKLRLIATLTLIGALASCGDGEPVDLDDAGGDIIGSIASEGFNRTFVLHVPRAHDAEQPAPLVIAFHGTDMTGANMQDLTVFEAFADQHGFLTIYLDGIDGGWSIGCDCTTPDALGINDVTTIENLLASVTSSFAIDMDRVYLAGFSQGGLIAQIAACELSGRIAGVASVGATTPNRIADTCTLETPLSILFIHGTDDTIVPYDGRESSLSAQESLAKWSELNGCVGDAAVTSEPDRDPNDLTLVRSETFTSCEGGAEVSLYTVEGGGHTWPRGQRPLGSDFGVVSQDISGSEVITEFFVRHQL